jgi:DNA replication and repair protein RecF
MRWVMSPRAREEEAGMYVERLRLADFRNYAALDLALPRGLVVFSGNNAQGKSNLLEAVSLIATSRSFRTSTEREVVRWGAGTLFARVDATVKRRTDELHVEVVIADLGAPMEGAPARPAPDPAMPQPPATFRKRIKVNGTPRRAMDLLGQVTIVVFAPTDLELVTGSPAQRRRFLDMTLCQVHPVYTRTLSQYQKVVAQRAALLRRIKDGEESPHALGFWDDQLAQLATPILRERDAFLRRAGVSAASIYRALSRVDDALAGEDEDAAGEDTDAEEPALRLVYQPSFAGSLAGKDAEVAAAFKAQLASVRRREIAQGANVVGPHRDDLAFLADGVDLSTYGSRGQQRSVALALKLAELAYIEEETGDQPILLLDDVLSELDARRRADLLAAVRELDQVLLTTTDATSIPDEAMAYAHVYRVRAGKVIASK